jgi:hypothetical protein
MNNVLLTAGVAAIILAVVGGGAQAFGVEVPIISSRLRQVALGLVGVAFIALAFVVGDEGSGRPSDKVLAYRQEVLAACRSLHDLGGSPTPDQEGMFDRELFLAFTKSQFGSAEEVLANLWSRPVPRELKDDRAEARQDANNLFRRARKALDRLAPGLPERFDYFRGVAFFQQLNNELREPAARVEASMSRLAAEPCTPSVSAGS